MVGFSASVITVLHKRLGVILIPDVSDDSLKSSLAHDLPRGRGLNEIVVRRVVSVDSDIFGVSEQVGILLLS